MVGLPTSAEGPPAAEALQDLSPEDVAWVDSCLVKNGGNGPVGGEGRIEPQSDDAWAALAEAFVDALAYAASGNATATATEEEEGKKKVEESLARVDGSGETARVDASGDELMAYDAEHAVTGEQASSPTASAFAATFYDQASPTLGDSFSGEGPSAVADHFEGTAEGNTSSGSDGGLDAAAVVIGNEYREEPEGYGSDGDGEDEFSIPEGEEVGEVELTRDIFRVWELGVTAEDGDEDDAEFGRQLKRALEGSSAGGTAAAAGLPLPADAEEWRTSAVALDDDGESLEKLIAGIGDISLGRPSSSD